MKQRPGFYMSRREGIVTAHLTMFKLEIVFNFVLRAAIVSWDINANTLFNTSH